MFIEKIIQPERYRTTDWSGGTTTQIYLFPETGSYKEQRFDYRLSTATVDVDYCPFTHLPAYHRLIMSLTRPISLLDLEEHTKVTLAPFTAYAFEGNQKIVNQGQCTDFNLMYDNHYQGQIRALLGQEILYQNMDVQFIYALCDCQYEISEKQGRRCRGILEAHHTLMLDQVSQMLELKLTPKEKLTSPAIAIWLACSQRELICTFKRRTFMMDSQKMNAQEQEKAKFSLSGATLYGINAVIGSGIFLLPQSIYKDLGPASIVVMLGTAILTIMLAVCFAEVSGYFGKNGGAFQYSKRAFGNFIGFNVGILGWVVTIFAWAAMAAGFAKIFIITFPAFEGWNVPLSIGLVVLLSLMNIAGLRTSKVLTITATIAKLIPIVAFSICTIFFFKNGLGNFTPFVQLSEGKSLFSAISGTAVYIFYGFIGFETLSIVAGEMRNPEKNVPRATLASISIVSVLYMLIIGGTIAMLGPSIMNTNAPVQDAFVKMIGPAGAWLVSIGTLISITGLNMGESIMVPRYGAAIADEGLLPSVIAKKNGNGAPLVAICISSAIAIVLLVSGSFETLATLSVVFRFFQYIPTALAVIKLRKDEPTAKVVFRVPFGPVIPILGVIISLVMIYGDNPMNYVYGTIGVVISSTIYYLMHGRKNNS